MKRIWIKERTSLFESAILAEGTDKNFFGI